MACSFSAVGDPSRLSGSRSSQARYSSCSASRVATAAAQRGDRGRPTLRARQETRRRRGGVGVVRPALLGPVPRLPLGRGHRHGADATCRHLILLLAIVTSRFATVFKPSFFVRPGTVSPSRPGGRRSAARRRGQDWPKATAVRRREAVLTAASTAPHSVRAEAIMPLAATPPSCARRDAACSGSASLRASSRASRLRVLAPNASSSPYWGKSARRGCVA